MVALILVVETQQGYLEIASAKLQFHVNFVTAQQTEIARQRMPRAGSRGSAGMTEPGGASRHLFPGLQNGRQWSRGPGIGRFCRLRMMNQPAQRQPGHATEKIFSEDFAVHDLPFKMAAVWASMTAGCVPWRRGSLRERCQYRRGICQGDDFTLAATRKAGRACGMSCRALFARPVNRDPRSRHRHPAVRPASARMRAGRVPM
jgi:hypothetical protein